MNRFLALLLVLGGLAVGCEEDKEPPPIVFNNSTTNNNNNNPDMPVEDMETDTADMDVPDIDEPDTNVDDPGFLNGKWEFRKEGSDTLVAVLTIRHISGDTTATGTWTMTDPAGAGNLTQVQWLQGDGENTPTFSTSWEFRVDNQSTIYGISAGKRSDDNTINASWLYQLTGDFGPAVLSRIE